MFNGCESLAGKIEGTIPKLAKKSYFFLVLQNFLRFLLLFLIEFLPSLEAEHEVDHQVMQRFLVERIKQHGLKIHKLFYPNIELNNLVGYYLSFFDAFLSDFAPVNSLNL